MSDHSEHDEHQERWIACLYETAEGLYHTEAEAKANAWMGTEYFQAREVRPGEITVDTHDVELAWRRTLEREQRDRNGYPLIRYLLNELGLLVLNPDGSLPEGQSLPEGEK